MEVGSSEPDEQSPAPRLVLVVDDDPVTLTVLAHQVTRFGATVHTATSARQALALLDIHIYQLVILDAHLPDSHGAEIARIIRSDTRSLHTPILAISSDDSSDNILRLKQMGINQFALKPLSGGQLAHLLERWL